MSKNGKDRFYRTLNLNKEDKKALKFYTELKKEVEKDIEGDVEENDL